jgi:dTMP kinase
MAGYCIDNAQKLNEKNIKQNPVPMTDPGLFLSFEGGEACGKSTQVAMLEQRLERQGLRALRLREPGGTPAGEQIRHLLQHDAAGENLVPEAELLLFAASRAQLVRERIRPALELGTWVLCDRFLDSTTVYQGVARRLPRADVEKINAFAVGETLPDLTILLDLPVDTAMQRLRQRGAEVDRMEGAPLDFHEAVREGYRDLAAKNPQRIFLFDAALEPVELHEQIVSTLNQRHGLSL